MSAPSRGFGDKISAANEFDKDLSGIKYLISEVERLAGEAGTSSENAKVDRLSHAFLLVQELARRHESYQRRIDDPNEAGFKADYAVTLRRFLKTKLESALQINESLRLMTERLFVEQM